MGYSRKKNQTGEGGGSQEGGGHGISKGILKEEHVEIPGVN